MSYIYAALTLQGMGKEINEANLRKVLQTMGVSADETEIDALLALVNHSAPKGVELKGGSALASQIADLNHRMSALEQRMAEIENPPLEFPESELAPPGEAEPVSEVEIPEAKPEAPTEVKTIGKGAARYLYCVADSAEGVSLGKIGVEGNEVYTIPYRDLCAVVHDCPCEPYKSEDEELVKTWVMTHQNVVDTAQQRFGTVLPLGFDTIIRGEEDLTPEENMRNWLKDDYQNLVEKVERLRGKDEYGVQIFWNPKVIADRITQTNEEIKKIDQEMKSKPKGTAYMYKQKLEDALKTEMETMADQYFKDFYHRIKEHAEDVKVDKTKRADEDKQMLMNLSCLVNKDKYKELGEELEGIRSMDGLSVRFTGPWPPYSFVAPG